MKYILRFIIALWLIATTAWVGVIIANIVISGWEIIGPWDIWPMVLAAAVMIAIVIKLRSGPVLEMHFDVRPAGRPGDGVEHSNNTEVDVKLQKDIQSRTVLEYNGNEIRVRTK